jgi:hypothetical protein
MDKDTTAAVVLRDNDGGLFLIPRSALENFRVPDAVRTALEQPDGTLSDEVSGYFMQGEHGSTLQQVSLGLRKSAGGNVSGAFFLAFPVTILGSGPGTSA